MDSAVQSLTNSGDVLFLMLGAVMVFAMHAGFAFLEVGTVRKKNQTNALVKILTDWSVSTVVYFLIGYPIAYGIHFFMSAESMLGANQGYELVLRSMYPGNHLRRHSREDTFLASGARRSHLRRPYLPFLRIVDLGAKQFRSASLVRRNLRSPFP
jgi:hypothetical protein